MGYVEQEAAGPRLAAERDLLKSENEILKERLSGNICGYCWTKMHYPTGLPNDLLICDEAFNRADVRDKHRDIWNQAWLESRQSHAERLEYIEKQIHKLHEDIVRTIGIPMKDLKP